MAKHEPTTKHDAILLAALHLFVEQGVHATPTSKIAERAGVATGTLFHHFATKEALIDALYLQIKRDLLTALGRELNLANTLPARVKQFWRNTLDWIMTHPLQHRLLLQLSHANVVSSQVRQRTDAEATVVAQLVREGKEQGFLKDLPEELLGELHYAIVQVTAGYFLAHPEEYQNLQRLEAAFAAYWDALRL